LPKSGNKLHIHHGEFGHRLTQTTADIHHPLAPLLRGFARGTEYSEKTGSLKIRTGALKPRGQANLPLVIQNPLCLQRLRVSAPVFVQGILSEGERSTEQMNSISSQSTRRTFWQD